MPDLRTQVIRLAATFPEGTLERKALLNILADTPADMLALIESTANHFLGRDWRGENRKDTFAITVRDGEVWPEPWRGSYFNTIPNLIKSKGKGMDGQFKAFLVRLDKELRKFTKANRKPSVWGGGATDRNWTGPNKIGLVWNNSQGEREAWSIDISSAYEEGL